MGEAGKVVDHLQVRLEAGLGGFFRVRLEIIHARDAVEELEFQPRLIAEKARAIAEGAGALSLAAALTGKAGDGPIVCVVSGGNIDLAKFAELVTA